MEMKMKSISHRCDINTPRSSQGYKYSKLKKCLCKIMLTCINNLATFEAQFMKKFSNTKAELKKSVYMYKRV